MYRVYKEKAKDKRSIEKQPILSTNIASIIESIEKFLEDTSINLESSSLDSYFNSSSKEVKPCLLYITSLLIQQPLGQGSLEEYPSFNSAVLTFLAIKSNNIARRITKEAINIEQDCSHLIYTLRLLSIAIIDTKYKILKESNSTIKIEVFLDYYPKNLTFNSSNSVEESTQIRAYNRAVVSNTLSKPRIRDINTNIIIIDNTIELDITKLKSFNSYIEDSIEEFLFSGILYLNPSTLL